MDGFASPQFLHNPKATVSTVGYGDDNGVHAEFSDDFIKNEYRSDVEGHVVYDHYYMLEMQWPGDNTKSFKYRFSKAEGEKGNEWTQRFARQWEAFKNSKEQVTEGTPIEMWSAIDKLMVFQLKANKIFTVEQIAAVKDTDVQSALGLEGRKLRDKAVAFLSPDANAAQLSKLMRESEDKDRRMAIMEQQLAALSGDSSAGQPVEHKKRGPKPKIHSTAA